MKIYKAFIFILLTAWFVPCHGQQKVVTWDFKATPAGKNKALITLTVSIADHWHIYSQLQEGGGPVPTVFKFNPSKDYDLVGKVMEISAPLETFDTTFLIPVIFFEKKAVFTQRIKLKTKSPFSISGSVDFMACSEAICFPPEVKKFVIEIKSPGYNIN